MRTCDDIDNSVWLTALRWLCQSLDFIYHDQCAMCVLNALPMCDCARAIYERDDHRFYDNFDASICFFFFPGRSFTELPKRNCEYFRTIFTYIVHTALLIPKWYVAVDWNDGHDVWMCRWWFFWPPAATVNSSKTHMNFNNSNRKKERKDIHR